MQRSTVRPQILASGAVLLATLILPLATWAEEPAGMGVEAASEGTAEPGPEETPEAWPVSAWLALNVAMDEMSTTTWEGRKGLDLPGNPEEESIWNERQCEDVFGNGDCFCVFSPDGGGCRGVAGSCTGLGGDYC